MYFHPNGSYNGVYGRDNSITSSGDDLPQCAYCGREVREDESEDVHLPQLHWHRNTCFRCNFCSLPLVPGKPYMCSSENAMCMRCFFSSRCHNADNSWQENIIVQNRTRRVQFCNTATKRVYSPEESEVDSSQNGGTSPYKTQSGGYDRSSTDSSFNSTRSDSSVRSSPINQGRASLCRSSEGSPSRVGLLFSDSTTNCSLEEGLGIEKCEGSVGGINIGSTADERCDRIYGTQSKVSPNAGRGGQNSPVNERTTKSPEKTADHGCEDPIDPARLSVQPCSASRTPSPQWSSLSLSEKGPFHSSTPEKSPPIPQPPSAIIESSLSSLPGGSSKVDHSPTTSRADPSKLNVSADTSRNDGSFQNARQKFVETSETNLSTAQNQPVCNVCYKLVYETDRLNILHRVYHHPCFKCSKCQIKLNAKNYFDKDTQAFCKRCYKEEAMTARYFPSPACDPCTRLPEDFELSNNSYSLNQRQE